MTEIPFLPCVEAYSSLFQSSYSDYCPYHTFQHVNTIQSSTCV